MTREYPHAASVPLGYDRDDVIALARKKYSAALANDTKWNALIDHFREQAWQPSYRSKWVNGHISDWDVEWFYHLPFPFSGVEWLNIGLHGYEQPAPQGPRQLLDHTAEITAKLSEIGLGFEVRGDVARIWGYYPKCFTDFPPA